MFAHKRCTIFSITCTLFILLCIPQCMPIRGNYSIGTQEISFLIKETQRQIIAEIYYPIDFNEKLAQTPIDFGVWKRKDFIKNAPISKKQAKYPLIIFSHGFQGDRFGNSWIAEHLVEKGYIVVMIEHTYNTSYDHNDLFIYTSMWQRPLDMTALLDYLLEDKEWQEKIDETKIGAGGFSLGGLTALWLAGIQGNATLFKDAMIEYSRWTVWPEWAKEIAENVNWQNAEISYKDSRIKAVFAISPDLGKGFTKEGIKKDKIPTLILVGDQDFVTPAASNASFYAKNMERSEIIMFKDVEHFTFLNCCSDLGKHVVPHLCNDPSSINRQEVHQTAAQAILDFLQNVFFAP